MTNSYELEMSTIVMKNVYLEVKSVVHIVKVRKSMGGRGTTGIVTPS